MCDNKNVKGGAQHRTELLKIWETQEFVRLPPLE